MPGIGVMGLESTDAGRYFYYIFTITSILNMHGGIEIAFSPPSHVKINGGDLSTLGVEMGTSPAIYLMNIEINFLKKSYRTWD